MSKPRVLVFRKSPSPKPRTIYPSTSSSLLSWQLDFRQSGFIGFYISINSRKIHKEMSLAQAYGPTLDTYLILFHITISTLLLIRIHRLCVHDADFYSVNYLGPDLSVSDPICPYRTRMTVPAVVFYGIAPSCTVAQHCSESG